MTGKVSFSVCLRLNIASSCAGGRQCEVVLHLAHRIESKIQGSNNDTCGIPTQLALVELESTPLDHSGKVSLLFHSVLVSCGYFWWCCGARGASKILDLSGDRLGRAGP